MSEEPISKGERTQAEIIAAANRLFNAHGYHATSMRQIAREASIALGGIYNHFESKEKIFQAVILAYHPYHQILPALENARGQTVAEFVRDAAARMVAALGDSPDFLNLMFIELVEFKGQHLPLLFKSIFPRVLVFAQRFLDGREELRTIPMPILLRSFLGLFFSYFITELFLNDQKPTTVNVGGLDDFVEIYLHGVLKDNPLTDAEVAS